MEEENKVSLWVGKLNNEEEFKRYIEETYDDEGEMFSPFMKDFDIDYYDSQFREALFNSSGNKNEIFEDFSYIENFISKLSNTNFYNYNCFILLYNFNYKGGKNKGNEFIYIETLDYQ